MEVSSGNDDFGDITISPSGEYYAATLPLEDRTGLVVMRRSDLKITASVTMGKNSHVKTPVFLAAGGEDDLASIAHFRLMERRSIAAGVPVETLYFDTEAHGFYTEPHSREFYEKLLALFDRNLGAR